jgi:ABC-2 type transport system ATP-binding protein
VRLIELPDDGGMLTVDRVSKRFGDLVALDECSLSVERGNIVGFLGPNGAGKTTTMRIVLGLIDPDSGGVAWDGTPIDAVMRLRCRRSAGFIRVCRFTSNSSITAGFTEWARRAR